MKNKINITFIISLAYIICYLVIKICNKPNPEFFNNNNNNNSSNDNDENSISLMKAVENKRVNFEKQVKSQNKQDQEIDILKRKVDSLRNDLVIMKKQEQDELGSIHNSVNINDSVVQALGVEGGKVLGNMINGKGKNIQGLKMNDSKNAKDSDGTNYNLHFNLQDE